MKDEDRDEKAHAQDKAKPLPKVQSAPMILIVGAGPTGLTLACELARRNVSLRLIEAAPARSLARAARASNHARSKLSMISASSIVSSPRAGLQCRCDRHLPMAR